MTRPLRIEYAGAFYHVLNRGNRRENIFLSDEDRDLFMAVLEEVHEIFDIKFLAYCLMPNHYHLLVRTPRPNLQKAMRHLGSVYTRRFNKKHKNDGHLFRGRYKAILVEEQGYLQNIIRYIHLNPVAAGITLGPGEWHYSSHCFYTGSLPNFPAFLDIETGVEFFSGSREVYINFLGLGIDPQTEKFYSSKKLNPIYGSKSFQKRILRSKGEISKDIECQRELISFIDRGTVVDAISRAFEILPSEVGSTRRGQRNNANAMAMILLSEKSGLSYKEIAHELGLKSDKAVSVGIHRFKKQLKFNDELAGMYEALLLHVACRDLII